MLLADNLAQYIDENSNIVSFIQWIHQLMKRRQPQEI
jgi:hypothetical protein